MEDGWVDERKKEKAREREGIRNKGILKYLKFTGG